jgi:hypothetical protein
LHFLQSLKITSNMLYKRLSRSRDQSKKVLFLVLDCTNFNELENLGANYIAKKWSSQYLLCTKR